MEKVDAVIVGGGVIGLAIARELSASLDSCVLLEQANTIAQGVSARNSGVIHAGLYYPHGSSKARLCVRGRQLLYDYCERKRVPHRRCGKLLLARETEHDQLQALFKQGLENGVEGLSVLERAALKKREPAVEADLALYSAETGIVDAAMLASALRDDFEARGGIVLCHTRLEKVLPAGSCYELHCRGSEAYRFSGSRLVNAAGLSAREVAASIEGFDKTLIPQRYLCKGNYFRYTGRQRFNHLIYPLPAAGLSGLGIHATHDLQGALRFGPDVQYIDTEDYRVDESRAGAFYRAIRQYFPTLEDDSLVPDFAGIRPKLAAEGEAAADFLIQSETDHHHKALANLFGIESPGLTASMAIAEDVASLLV